jgi:hypothetical protein
MVLNNANLYFSLDDADLTGSNPDDISGTGNNGTNVGATTGITGKINEGFDFVTGNSYITVADHASLNPSALTVAFWYNPDTLTTVQILFHKGNFTQGYYCDSTAAGNIRFAVGHSSFSALQSLGTVTTGGGWYHIVCTYDGTTKRIYINGALDNSTTGGDSNGTGGSSGALVFATRADALGVQSLDGQLDEIGLYPRAISLAEVQSLYNGGSGFNPYAAPSGYSNKVNGVTPSKINGVAVANISKFNGVA